MNMLLDIPEGPVMFNMSECIGRHIRPMLQKESFVVRRLAVGPTGRWKPARDSNPESSDDFAFRMGRRDNCGLYTVILRAENDTTKKRCSRPTTYSTW